jgi:hypothetical protein
LADGQVLTAVSAFKKIEAEEEFHWPVVQVVLIFNTAQQ